MPALPRRLALLAPLAVTAVIIGGCGATTADGTPTTPVRTGVDGSLGALTDKIDLIALDECATDTAATVFPNCARFVAEVGTVAVAVTGAAPGRPDAARLQSAAAATSAATAAFVRDGCLASPSGQAPPATTCGPDLQQIQTSLKAMQAAVHASTPTSAPGE